VIHEYDTATIESALTGRHTTGRNSSSDLREQKFRQVKAVRRSYQWWSPPTAGKSTCAFDLYQYSHVRLYRSADVRCVSHFLNHQDGKRDSVCTEDCLVMGVGG